MWTKQASGLGWDQSVDGPLAPSRTARSTHLFLFSITTAIQLRVHVSQEKLHIVSGSSLAEQGLETISLNLHHSAP